MRSRVVLVGVRWRSKDCAAPNAEVLAKLIAPLLIQGCLGKDIDATVPCPIPVSDLFAKIL